MTMTPRYEGRVGEADKYVLTLADGSEHRFIVSNCERAVAGDGGASAIARAIARIERKNKAGS